MSEIDNSEFFAKIRKQETNKYMKQPGRIGYYWFYQTVAGPGIRPDLIEIAKKVTASGETLRFRYLENKGGVYQSVLTGLYCAVEIPIRARFEQGPPCGLGHYWLYENMNKGNGRPTLVEVYDLIKPDGTERIVENLEAPDNFSLKNYFCKVEIPFLAAVPGYIK